MLQKPVDVVLWQPYLLNDTIDRRCVGVGAYFPMLTEKMKREEKIGAGANFDCDFLSQPRRRGQPRGQPRGHTLRWLTHYGPQQKKHKKQPSNHARSHELGSEQSERASKASSAKQANE